MKKKLFILLLLSACLVGISYGIEITIKTSPNTLVLDGSDDYAITIHTNLKYSSAYTATINGHDAVTFYDDRGFLVARAWIPADVLSAGPLPVELIVSDETGEIGSGTDTIAVVDKNTGPQPGPIDDPGSGPGEGPHAGQ